jgi:DNA-binding SARP family transcriptional activator/tetratricopeptide (TPR) repeat protein
MSAPAPVLIIRLLGPLEVVVGGRPVVVDTRKALAIVALIAAESRPFARDELAAMFWPEADDEAARGALRRTLSALRSAVGGYGLVIERTRVGLDRAASTVDLRELERLAASSSPADLEAAATLARGPFLAGFALRDSPAFDDWQAARAARMEQTVSDVLDRLVAARLAAGDAVGAGEAATRRVELNPLDESGQRRLIDLLARTGDRSGAIRRYRSLVALFDRELGVLPLRETSELYDSIREDRAGFRGTPVAEVRPTPASGLPFVGRDTEVATILDAVGSANRDGGLVIVEGEAGIGKTRLADEVADDVRRRGGVVISSRGYPGEMGIAYGPIADLLRSGAASVDGADRLARLDATALGEIGRLIQLPIALRASAHVLQTRGSGARVRLLNAIADALTALVAGPVPGIVMIDDLHHADASTRQAVTFIARRLENRPFTLFVTWRPEELSADGRGTADDLARIPGAVVVSLDRLDRAAIAILVRASRSAAPSAGDSERFITAGHQVARPARAGEIDAVMADSEGIPLHVMEALARDEAPGGAVSRGVRELLRQRIEAVGETAAQVLSAAAVIGRSFDLTTLRQASGRSEEEIVVAVEELTRRGIVRELPAAPGAPVRYDFSHGRLRDVAYEATSVARRRLLHRRTADALRLNIGGSGRDDVGHFALIAGHERAAGRTLEAASAYAEAADRAEAVFANDEAIVDLEAALALGHPGAAGLHARIGGLWARLGAYPHAIRELETAAALATAVELPAVELALGRVHLRRGDLAAAESHLVAALGSPELSPSLRVRTLVERSLVALRAGDLEVAAAMATKARTFAADLGEPHVAGVAERLVGLVALARADVSAARSSFERSVILAADDPDPTAAIAATTALALAIAAEGDVDGAVEVAGRAIDLCRRAGDRHLEAAVENHLADLLHGADRDLQAMEHLKRAVALFAEIGERAPEPEPGIWALAAW